MTAFIKYRESAAAAVPGSDTVKGSGLSNAEIDGNFRSLKMECAALQSNKIETTALNNVNNTSDANKPVSTAQQTALNLKVNLAGGAQTVTSPLTLNGASTFGAAATFNAAAKFSAGVMGGESALPTYEVNLDSSSYALGTWFKLVTLSLVDAAYSSYGFVIELIDPNNNHSSSASTEQIITSKYIVACVRSGSVTLNDVDACFVRGPSTHIRAVKTSQGNYEIQCQNLAQWREYRIKFTPYALSENHVQTVTYHNGSTLGSTGVAQYTAVVGAATDWFQNVKATKYESTVATGTAPLTVASETKVAHLNADLLDGAHLDTSWNSSVGGTIPVRHASGYLSSNFFHTTADLNTGAPSHIAGQWFSDNYIRWQTWAQFKTNIFDNPQLTGAVKVGSMDFRIKSAAATTGYGVVHRNDGTGYYILLTNNNDADGNYNALRPFTINLSTGLVTLGTVNSGTINGTTIPSSATLVTAAALAGAYTINGTAIPANSTLLTTVNPNIGTATATSINGTSIPSSATLLTTANLTTTLLPVQTFNGGSTVGYSCNATLNTHVNVGNDGNNPITINLPGGVEGAMIWITWTNSRVDNVVAPYSGQGFEWIVGNMTLDTTMNGTVQLRYLSNYWRIL